MEKKPDLVVVLSRFPYPLEKGDKLRSYYQIKELSSRFDVHLIALTDSKVSTESKKELDKFCVSVTIYELSTISILVNVFIALLGTKPIQVGYFYNYFIHQKIKKQLKEIRPAHIFSQLIRTTEYTKNYLDCPKTLDYMDALSKGMERRSANELWFKKWFFKMEYRRLLAYERVMFDYFDKKTIISEQDKNFIFHPDRAQIVCIPNGIDAHFLEELTLEKKHDFAFVGNMNYAPNVEAVLYIIEEILPAFPDSKLIVAGATPHPKIEKAAKNNPNVTVTGWVDDIREAYLSAKIFLAPMQTGTGMQNKLLEAMALGLPCLTTSLANNAIGAVHGESILVADNSMDIKNHLRVLLSNEARQKEIGQQGKSFVESKYSWKKATQKLI